MMTRKSIEKTLSKLISLKSISSNKQENNTAIGFIINQLPRNLLFEKKEYNGHPVLIIGSKTPSICLQAHVDVVPGKEDLFKAKIIDNRLYGRGSYDMKFAIACYLEVIKKIDITKTNIGILITSDEEVGGFNGVNKVLEEGYSPSLCFLPDGERPWNFDKQAKGAWHLEVSFTGTSGHASRPWEGDSAIKHLVSFADEINNLFPLPPEEQFIDTVSIGVVRGGEAANQIADFALAKIDVRFVSEESRLKIKKIITDTANKRRGTCRDIVYAPSFSALNTDIYFEKYRQIAEENNRHLTEHPSHATSDARFFGAKNIPTIVTRPKGGGAHSDNEWVDLDDLIVFCKILEKFILSL